MYEQIREDIIFVFFYGVVTAMALIASLYLLFRRANAIAPDITPPVRLRRWTSAFFMVFVLNHVWFMPTYFLTSSDDAMMFGLVGVLLDCMTFFPIAIIVLLVMLQDRRRPLWPIPVMVAPLVAGMLVSVINRSLTLLPMLSVYLLMMSIGLIIYMVRSLRQYGRWLRDNYADLEHKEVWQSFVAIFVCWLILCFYIMIDNSRVFAYIVQVNDIVLIGLLLWRVETLQRLDEQDDTDCHATPCEAEKPIPSMALSAKSASSIGQLLEQHCEATHLYLRRDIRLGDLSKAIGTNRSYLSQYFAQQHTTYNAYINNLRIEHFIRLYRESVDSGHPFTAQQLAQQSGFRSYSTFGMAFKQRMGQTVTAWMRDIDGR